MSGLLGPVTANPMMLAQALKAKEQPRKQLTGQGLLDTAAIGLSTVPVIGDAIGLAADASRYINDPSSRTPLNFGLTALGALPFVPPAAAIFAGPLAKTAKLDQKTLAEGMEKAGRSRDDIWKETGWFKGPEGKWKFEIDDSGAKFNQSKVNGITKENDLIVGQPNFDYGPTVGGLLEHGALKSAYPNGLTKSTFVGNKNSMFGDGVQGSLSDGVLTVNAPAKASDAKSTTLHELQHAIQDREGFAKGGMPSEMAKVLDEQKLQNYLNKDDALTKQFDTLKSQWQGKEIPANVAEQVKKLRNEIESVRSAGMGLLKKRSAFGDTQYSSQELNDAYRRLAGEAEARAVQARMNMNQQQRQATPPWQSYDVPWEQLIIK